MILFYKPQIIQSWIKRIGGKVTVEKFREFTTESSIDFHFDFSTIWQPTFLQNLFSLFCLDSSHSAFHALNDPWRKTSPYTIIVKYDTASRKVPVAFLLTSSEYQGLLENWLLWLKKSVPLKGSPIFMVECFRIELAAIITAFENSELCLCYWHMLPASRMQAALNLWYSEKVCDMKGQQTSESLGRNQ